jgi:hypothetical protein
VQQRRLARPDLAGEGDEPLALLDPVQKLREHLAMGSRLIEKLRVRRQLERHLVETVEV